MPTGIEWTEETWNPVTGCTKVSDGCRHCYAEKMAKRLAGRCGYPAGVPFKVTFHPDRLDQPGKWRKPKMVFVCSMGDLFHDDLTDDQILAVYDAMCDAPQHTYQLLTKRPERMRDAVEYIHKWSETGHSEELSHIWHGVSAENQECFDERVPLLLQTPSAVRFVSAEPLLGPIDFGEAIPPFADCCNYAGGCTRPENPFAETTDPKSRPGIDSCRPGYCVFGRIGIDGVIVGGESGPGARPMHPQWVRDIRDQCRAAGVPFFFKQWGQWAPLADHKELRETANKFALVSRDGDVSYSDDGVITAHLDGNDYAAAMVWMRNKHDAGRVLDGRTWDEKPQDLKKGDE